MYAKLVSRIALAACWGLLMPTWTHAVEPSALADSEKSWGALSGRFVYRAGEPLLTTENALTVEPATRGVKNVLVYARRVSRVRPSSEDGKAALDIKDCAFNPRVLALRLYQLLKIRNRDSVAHIFLMRPPLGVETNILLGSGDEIDHQFTTKQYFPAVANCSLHPWMTAYVLLRDDPYFAVTDDYGWFEVRDLPAGEEIEFQVWHELGRGPSGSLEAKPEWVKGRFHVSIPPGGVLDLGTIEIAPSALRLESRADMGSRLPVDIPR